ncbi:MAG: radical SAM/SPASM domain-containing protein [Thermoanaerobaculia bacterium]
MGTPGGAARTLLRLSPFVLPQADGTFINLVTDRTLRISAEAWSRLRALGPVFSEDSAEEALGEDTAEVRRFLDTLRDVEVLVPDSPDLFRSATVRYADIEISSHCNARCRFCPVADDPLPRRVMSMVVFEHIVDAIRAAPLRWVSMNHYNEPMLDPTFFDKAQILAAAGLPLRLFTNGVRLDRTAAERLAADGNVDAVIVNIPSVDPERYSAKMGVRMRPRLHEEVAAASHVLPLFICVNGNPVDAEQEAAALREHFSALGANATIYVNLTHDRAGLLGNDSVMTPGRWSGSLGGCRRFYEHLSVNVEGKVFLCCQDYRQDHILGDLMTQPLDAILTGHSATEYRRRIFGDLPADDDFLCRTCVELQRGHA